MKTITANPSFAENAQVFLESNPAIAFFLAVVLLGAFCAYMIRH